METTKYKKKELKHWYSTFIKDYPSGQLNKDQFNNLYNKLYISHDTNQEKTNRIFGSFDQNHDGLISFKELASTLSITSRGTLREKLEWLFDVYDTDGDSLITLQELTDVVKSVHDSVQKHESDKTLKPECRVRRISCARMANVFMFVDKDNDGYLTVDEFIEGVEGNPELASLFNCGQVVPFLEIDGNKVH